MKFTRDIITGLIITSFLACSDIDSNKTGWDYETTKSGFEIKNDSLSLTIKQLNINDTINHFRGLFEFGNAFFISGTDGKILIKTFQLEQVELFQAKYTDLRDIHILPDSSILVMGIASPGHIWKINKGETQWRKVYTNMDSTVFMDGMDFWNDSVGIVYGDPLNGYHFILKTIDGGESWTRISSENIADILPIEAGFAASGTGIVCTEGGTGYIGLGGEKARVLVTHNYGENWQVSNPQQEKNPILQGSTSTGIYSLAFKDSKNGVAVGGNWEDPECDSSKMYTTDGGLNWLPSKGLQHYRSCVIYLKDDIYISTGTSGTDISYDGGKNWVLLDSTGFNAIKFDKNMNGVAIGNYGTVAEVNLQ